MLHKSKQQRVASRWPNMPFLKYPSTVQPSWVFKKELVKAWANSLICDPPMWFGIHIVQFKDDLYSTKRTMSVCSEDNALQN